MFSIGSHEDYCCSFLYCAAMQCAYITLYNEWQQQRELITSNGLERKRLLSNVYNININNTTHTHRAAGYFCKSINSYVRAGTRQTHSHTHIHDGRRLDLVVAAQLHRPLTFTTNHHGAPSPHHHQSRKDERNFEIY